MVNFKNLFVATSLLLGSVAAAPAPFGAVNAVASRDISTLDRRAIWEGDDANAVKDNEYVGAMKIITNDGKAKVINLTGCTALFFYRETTLRRAVHILCGHEEDDAKTAAREAFGADSVTIGASSTTYASAAQRGVLAGKSDLKVKTVIYRNGWTSTTAMTLSAQGGSTDITEGTGPRLGEDDD